MDHSENYTCSEYEDVQSAIDKSSVTLHPMVVQFKNGEDVTNHMAHQQSTAPMTALEVRQRGEQMGQ